jgi:aminoglycoside 6-adenylyltransferase
VHAAVLVGSQARTDTPADEYSDADVVLFVDDPAPYLESAAWLEAFGTPLLTFIEGTATGGQLERWVLFESGLDVDFALVSTTAIPQLLSDRETAGAIARGFRILYDELDLAGRFAGVEPHSSMPDLDRLSHDVWYHLLLAAKKLRRGEIYYAKQMCDCYLKSRVVRLLHLRYPSPWHDGRFLERWAPAKALLELRESFASYDESAVETAVLATAALFARLERELGVDAVDHDELMRRLEDVLAR